MNPPRRWIPSPTIRASIALHAIAAVVLAATGGLTLAGVDGAPFGPALLATLGVLLLNHLLLTAAGLWPRSTLLGPNLTRLPPAAAGASLIALTIDDGPDPAVTPRVLDQLRRHGATASFFVIAARAERHPELIARIVAEGHEIENHTDRHSPTFAFGGTRRLAAEIAAAQARLTRLAGRPPALFRAPAGLRNPLLEPVLCRLGLTLASWTRRGFDTVERDPAKVLARLAGPGGSRLAAGDILLLHDGNPALTADGTPMIVAVLPELLALCLRGGLRPVPLRRALHGSADDAPTMTIPPTAAPEPAAGPPHRPPAPPRPTATPPPLGTALLDAATARYRPAGRFAYHFARGKLGADPAFGAIAHLGWIAPGSRVLDLGCGQGLLASLLLATGLGCRVRGIELMPADAERGRIALGDAAEIVCGDIREVPFGSADVAVILDVLHYLDYADQDRVLARLHAALAPAGLLLLRVGDADGGLPFRFSNWVDRVVTRVRGHRLGRLYCRPLSQWRRALAAAGFTVETMPLSQGTPFANVLLLARPIASEPANAPDVAAPATDG
ncbi:MAG: polysaccharide deacetylase family protein [Lautropia sp.]